MFVKVKYLVAFSDLPGRVFAIRQLVSSELIAFSLLRLPQKLYIYIVYREYIVYMYIWLKISVARGQGQCTARKAALFPQLA